MASQISFPAFVEFEKGEFTAFNEMLADRELAQRFIQKLSREAREIRSLINHVKRFAGLNLR